VVVGAGPGGITVVGNLLEHGAELQTDQRKLVWVDPHFQGGRVNARYREVPSNTKVNLFVQFANEVSPFRAIVKATPKPNALTALQELPQDQGCRLSYAADMCLMLTDGLTRHPDVQQQQGKVTSATLDEQTNFWKVAFDNGGHVTTSKIALCTGSGPVSKTLPAIEKINQPSLKPVDLDVALAPSILAKTIDSAENATVAVVGASHSAILVLMNLVDLASSSHPHLRI
jgi:cation diffusion facilitator CzcD-associated flavoprotein CzcO